MSFSFAPYIHIVAMEPEEPSIGSSGNPETETSIEASVSELVEQVSLTNHLLGGLIFFVGITVGVICMHHLFSRFKG